MDNPNLDSWGPHNQLETGLYIHYNEGIEEFQRLLCQVFFLVVNCKIANESTSDLCGPSS